MCYQILFVWAIGHYGRERMGYIAIDGVVLVVTLFNPSNRPYAINLSSCSDRDVLGGGHSHTQLSHRMLTFVLQIRVYIMTLLVHVGWGTFGYSESIIHHLIAINTMWIKHLLFVKCTLYCIGRLGMTFSPSFAVIEISH